MTDSSPRMLSLVCPVYNEADSLDMLMDKLSPVIDESLKIMGSGARYEIIFIDDGSADDTAAAITALNRKNPHVKLIRFSRNFGKEAALTAGLRHAKGDAVIPIDADLQDPPAIIPEMVRQWIAGAEVVNARRTSRASDSWIKRKTAGLFYKVFNSLVRLPIPENVGDFRLLDRKVVDCVNRIEERNRFMKFVFSWVGFKQATVGYEREERAAGESKFKYWQLWNLALDGITSATTTPLRIWTYIGIAMATLTLAYAVFIILKTMIYGIDEPGYASLMVVVLTIGSFNFISLGIMGEYIGRISEEVRRRPLYVISETAGIEEPPEQ